MSGSDIFGSKPGSLVKGIKVPSSMSQRRSNPLVPDYQMPGHSEEPVNIKVDPFGEEGCSMALKGVKKERPVTGVPKAAPLPPLAPAAPDARKSMVLSPKVLEELKAGLPEKAPSRSSQRNSHRSQAKSMLSRNSVKSMSSA